MDLLKNTTLATTLYVTFAFAVIVLGIWREAIYRGESDAQQRELTQKQQTIDEQQQELLRLVHKINDSQVGQSQDIKSLVEAMRKDGTLSPATAKDLSEVLSTTIRAKTSVVDVVTPAAK